MLTEKVKNLGISLNNSRKQIGIIIVIFTFKCIL